MGSSENAAKALGEWMMETLRRLPLRDQMRFTEAWKAGTVELNCDVRLMPTVRMILHADFAGDPPESFEMGRWEQTGETPQLPKSLRYKFLHH